MTATPSAKAAISLLRMSLSLCSVFEALEAMCRSRNERSAGSGPGADERSADRRRFDLQRPQTSVRLHADVSGLVQHLLRGRAQQQMEVACLGDGFTQPRLAIRRDRVGI